MVYNDSVRNFVIAALKEDIGRIDLTSTFLVPQALKVRAGIMAKSPGVLAGILVAETVFGIVDRRIAFKPNAKDGEMLENGKTVCYLEGPAAAILRGERVALNFMGRLSGVATRTRAFVDRVRGHRVEILDTRKTTPAMRSLEKAAVRAGGGKNHRMGLYDQVLIKENHLQAMRQGVSRFAGKRDASHVSIIQDAVGTARRKAQKNTIIEIEVRTITEFEAALSCVPDIIMLDNMGIEEIGDAVKIKKAAGSAAQRVKLEASGNITLANVGAYAATGIDRISIGSLTHSVESVDFSLAMF